MPQCPKTRSIAYSASSAPFVCVRERLLSAPSHCIPDSGQAVVLCSLAVGSASLRIRGVLVSPSEPTGMANPSLPNLTVLSVTVCTVSRPVARDNSLQLPSVAASSTLSLYPVSGSVAPRSRLCVLRSKRSLYTWSPGCASI